jgi:hypothetical protein
MQCKCNKCGMEVKGLSCGKCNSPLIKDKITANDGNKVQVAKCPKACGTIKSPTCCGQDMECYD